MSKITYNAESLKLMSLFEKITRTRIKDCFYDQNDLLTFVVNEVQIGKAIGKNAGNVKKLEQMLKRKIKIIAFNQNVVKFAKNLIYPIKADIELQENTLNFKVNEAKSKGILIGRNQSNLKNNLNIIKKYFKAIEEIKVI